MDEDQLNHLDAALWKTLLLLDLATFKTYFFLGISVWAHQVPTTIHDHF